MLLSATEWTGIFFSPFAVPIAVFAVIGVCGLAGIVSKAIAKHREQTLRHHERMAMIERGIHPDEHGESVAADGDDEATW